MEGQQRGCDVTEDEGREFFKEEKGDGELSDIAKLRKGSLNIGISSREVSGILDERGSAG